MNTNFKEFYSDYLSKNVVEKSEFKKVRIPIKTEYEWGEGWQNRNVALSFEKEMKQILENEGFTVKPGDSFGGCQTIDKTWGEYLYIHPMELTGYLTEEQLNKILNALSKAETIKAIYPVQKEEVYNLSNYQYEDFLFKNIKTIDKWINGNPRLDGFEFAKKYRIPRFRDSCVYSSNDVDVCFVDRLIKTKKCLYS